MLMNASDLFAEDHEDAKDILFDLNVTAYHMNCLDIQHCQRKNDESLSLFLQRSLIQLQSQLVDQQNHAIDESRTATVRNEKRPVCKKIETPPGAIHEIRQLFFDSFGCLRRDLRWCIDFGEKHGFIVLDLEEDETPRRDFRWILPLTVPSSENEAGQIPPMSLYGRIRSILFKHGLLDNDHEFMKDISIIIGGTAYQYLHRDFTENKTEGDYDVLNGPYCPATILIGLGSDCAAVRLAVRKEDVVLTTL